MHCIFKIGIVSALLIFITTFGSAEIHIVNSQQTFDQAHDDAIENDSILWETGTFSNIYMEISKDKLFIGSVKLGSTIFNGASKVKITADYITLEGLQFVGGSIGTSDIINTYGSYNHFNQLNIRDYKSYKYLRIREECQYNRVTYCNFENRLNLDDQNILSILVDENNPGYHKVQYCSFKNFDGTGNDLGIEPIRIGVSTQSEFISRSLVEFCYFTQCNGDGELISSKARQNVYRYNTFENNPKAELVLRHGSENVVYGNFFLNGKGGVRIREGKNQYIYNNYFYNLDDRTIYLQNQDDDPLDDINIAFNTVIDCSEFILGGSGSHKPTNVIISNNIFTDPDDDLFEDATGNETWISNIAFGDLGIALPTSGVTVVDPELVENSEGFWGLSPNSVAIDAAMAGYKELPQYEGMDPIDTTIVFDMMGQKRPVIIEEKDLGSNEFPHDITISPIATEENTGPSYDTDIVNIKYSDAIELDDLIHLLQNPVPNQTILTINTHSTAKIVIDIYEMNGRKAQTVFNERLPAGEKEIIFSTEILTSGVYSLVAKSMTNNGAIGIQTLNFVK